VPDFKKGQAVYYDGNQSSLHEKAGFGYVKRKVVPFGFPPDCTAPQWYAITFEDGTYYILEGHLHEAGITKLPEQFPDTVCGGPYGQTLVDMTKGVVDGVELPADRIIAIKADGLTINEMSKGAMETSTANGFTFNREDFPRAIALIHSEASEALEWDRNLWPFMKQAEALLGIQGSETNAATGTSYWKFTNPLYHHFDSPKTWFRFDEVQQKAIELQNEAINEELADIILRVGDLAGRMGLDLEAAVVAKMEKNKKRVNRHGGKEY